MYRQFSDSKSADNSSKSAPNGNTGSSQSKKKTADEPVNKYPAGDMTVFFGSQTGTAEGFSRIIMENAKSKGFIFI